MFNKEYFATNISIKEYTQARNIREEYKSTGKYRVLERRKSIFNRGVVEELEEGVTI